MKPTQNPFSTGATLVAFAITCSATLAVDRTWIGEDGDFNDSANWLGGFIPGDGDNAIINNNGIIRVTSDHTTNDILAGTSSGGTGVWQISAGKLEMSGGWFRLGTTENGEGIVNVDGGTLVTRGEQNLGETGGGTGVVDVSGGTWNNYGARLAVGGNSRAEGGGTGTLRVSGSSVVNNYNWLMVGAGSTAHGTVESSGGQLNVSDITVVGYNGGEGLVTVSGTAEVHLQSELWLGDGSTSKGTMNITGGTINQHGWIAIGRSDGTGVLNMTGGTFNKTANNPWEATLIGASGAGSGTFNQTGGVFNALTEETWIAESGSGEWKMSGGTANLGILNVGHDHDGNGTLTLQGGDPGDSTGNLANGGGGGVINATAVTLGRWLSNTTGTVNLDGGTLAANSVAKGEGSGTFNFNGGTLKANANNSSFVTGVTTMVKEVGAVIDSNGFDVKVDTVLHHGGSDAIDGGLIKNGAGTLTLTQANTYTGPTVINGGILVIAATGSIDSSSGISLGNGGSLDASAKGGITTKEFTGTGTVIGALTISTSLAIGNSPGIANFSGPLSFASSSTYHYEIDSTLDLADLGNVGGDLNLDSSHFDLIQLGSYQPGDKFTLFSYFGSLTGEFENYADDSVFTGGGGMWQINYDDTSGGHNGGTFANFVTITAVPEPSSVALLGLAGAALLVRRRRPA